MCADTTLTHPVVLQALDAALHFFKHDYQPANPRDAHFNLKLIAFSQLVRFRAITMLVRVRLGSLTWHSQFTDKASARTVHCRTRRKLRS